MKYSENSNPGSITYSKFNKIDDMFADFFPTSRSTDDMNMVEFSPTNSSNTRSADSTLLDNLTQPSPVTTASTSRLNNSDVSLDKLQEVLCNDFSSQLNSIDTDDSRFDKSMFDPYIGFFPCSNEENLSVTTADPIEIFFQDDGSVKSFPNKEVDLYERHNSADTKKTPREDEVFSSKTERNYIYSNNKYGIPEPNKVSKILPPLRNRSGDTAVLFKASKDSTPLVNAPQPCEPIPYPVACDERKENQKLVQNLEQDQISIPKLVSWNENNYSIPKNCLPTVFESIDDLPKIKQSKHRCSACFKVSKTSYGCANQIVKHLPNIELYKEYNTPNGYTLEYARKHGDSQYVYLASEVKNEYDPLVKRYTLDVQYNSKGKKLKRDYPSLCPFCKVSEARKFDSLFYERNNSCYRGHLINTHGINSMGEFAKLPESGFVCYKLGKNSWSETVGFKCPYENCDFCFLRGDKTHGFHEYIRHWNRSHIE